jgi:hypothetical protein
MKTAPLFVTVALEGSADVPIVERLLKDVGLEMGRVYVQGGKARLDRQLSGYNSAARFGHWLVVRDLDQDAACAPELKGLLLPEPSTLMCLRVAVRAAESWLLADAARLAAFLGVSAARVPGDPDRVPDPKGTIVNLARHSRKRDVREDMVPRPGSSARVGPGYATRIMEFAGGGWRPRTAVRNSPSLAGCVAALKRWKRRA